MSEMKTKIRRALRYIINGIPIVRPELSILAPSDLLKRRNALITGGTSGIGYQIAKFFLEAGANVVITGRDSNRLKRACEQLEKETNKVNSVFGMMMDNTEVRRFRDHIVEASNLLGHKEIDILVNNAGVIGGHITNATEEEYDKVLNTNLKAVFFLTKAIAEYMKEHNIQGNVLNIASSSGICPANSAYCVSKWGIRGLTEGFARSLAPLGIVVNGIAPGPTATPMLMDDFSDLSHGKIPNGRFTLPEEIANMAVVLVSNLGKSVIGDIVYMTGGAGNLTKENIRYFF